MRECLILAGGLGTRLAHLIPDLPKTLAPIQNKPFLYYLVQQLQEQGVERIIFSLGHRSTQIIDYVQSEFKDLKASFVVEQKALGTGGAIMNSIKEIESDNFFLVNADTFYNISFDQLEKYHLNKNAGITVSVKPIQKPSRYGTVISDLQGRILEFKEKSDIEYGLINGGIYCINKYYFQSKTWEPVFSLEKDVLEKYVSQDQMYSLVQDQYFIDIGVPEDYLKSQNEIPNIKNIKTKKTLFLDRDGVINQLIPESYVISPKELIFTDGFLDNIKRISSNFDYIFVVTNQQCIGKNLVSVEMLAHIHHKLIKAVRKEGGFITNIYYCPHLVLDHCLCRKPQPGLFDFIRQNYPDVNFSNSIFIGDNDTDRQAAAARNIPFLNFDSNFSNQFWSQL